MTSDELFALRPQIEGDAKRAANETRKIGVMHLRHGMLAGQAKCGDCAHFYRKELGGTYRKCLLFGDTSGPGTDWLARWNACGRFQRAEQ